MPYAVNADLPPCAHSHLPSMRRKFFARPSVTSAPPTPRTRQEEAAFDIARVAVKRAYEKIGHEWTQKG
jgi:cation transport regulator ChaB